MTESEIDEVAKALYGAIREGNEKAVVDGDPLTAGYFDGDLIEGVLVDGIFDFRKSAASLIGRLETLRLLREI
jgi:hypothetical protein